LRKEFLVATGVSSFNNFYFRDLKLLGGRIKEGKRGYNKGGRVTVKKVRKELIFQQGDKKHSREKGRKK